MRLSHYYTLAHVCIAFFLAQTPLANVARCRKASELYRNVSEATTHFEVKLSERLLSATFDPSVELVGYLNLFEYVVSSSSTSGNVYSNDKCTQSALTIANNNIGIYYTIVGQHRYQEAVTYFQAAIAADPHCIVLYRNLAWLQHAVTVDSDVVKSAYLDVWKLNWLRVVIRSALAGRVFKYTELRKQILPYLNIRSFEESKIPDSVSMINGTTLHSKNNDVLVIAGRTWDVQFVHTGHGSVTLSIASDDCVLQNHADHDCQLFFQDLLEIRPKILSLFEVGIGGASCRDPLLLEEAKNIILASKGMNAKHLHSMMNYLNLLKFQLIGFYDDQLASSNPNSSKFRQALDRHQRIALLSAGKKYSGQSLSISMGMLNNINSSIHLDIYPGETMASIGMLNNMYFVIKSLISSNVEGHFLEAGVWRGGMTIWMKVVLNAMLDVYALEKDFDYKVYVADSFGGVPPPRNSSAFSQDQWHHMPKNLYKVQLQHVVENFAKYFLFAPPEASGDENTIFMSDEIQFLPGYFNESFVAFDAPLSLLRIDADSYESILDVLDHLYDNVVPGGIIMIDDWHLNGARRAVLEFRLKRGILEPMIPVPEDSVYACEERNPYLFHNFPNKPIQGMFFVKRPNNEQSSSAKQYYAPFQSDLGIELDY